MSAMDMAEHQVPGSQSAFYIPNFVTPEEEEFLVRKVCVLISSYNQLDYH